MNERLVAKEETERTAWGGAEGEVSAMVGTWAAIHGATVLQTALQAEADALCNAGACQRNPQRTARRGGTYRRGLATRLGRLPLVVPRLDRPAGGSALLSAWSRDPDAVLPPLLDLMAGRNGWSSVQALLAPLRRRHGEAAWIVRLAQLLLDAAERHRRTALPLQAERLRAIPLIDPLRGAAAGIICLCLEKAVSGAPLLWFAALSGPSPGTWAGLLAQVRERGLLRPASVAVPGAALQAAARLWPAARILPGPDPVPLQPVHPIARSLPCSTPSPALSAACAPTRPRSTSPPTTSPTPTRPASR